MEGLCEFLSKQLFRKHLQACERSDTLRIGTNLFLPLVVVETELENMLLWLSLSKCDAFEKHRLCVNGLV